ncbi:MAG: hypothetical protein J0G28_14360 [Afipia sp.]|nr:hypothetical protein [Afipia sp.]OJW65724.1 MAG: hypothetical protein BGO65_12195 [Afipia sp. 64-13]
MRYRYSYVEDIIAFALKTLRERSPIGGAGDRHPGLYRDNHLVFLNGRMVSNARDWRPGDIIHISNPVPYSRKIEVGGMNLSVPSGVYEASAQIVDGRFGNQASIKFVYMPINFGGIRRWSDTTGMMRQGRKMSVAVRSEWLRRQPAIEIRGR